MLYKSALVTDLSGSIGGMTASHNKGGRYFRARVVPTDPSTTFQTPLRSFMNSLSNRWVETLTQVQRDAWAVYASAVPLVNPFGDPKFVSGINMFVRSNIPRLQQVLPQVDDAPTIFDLGDFTHNANGVDATADEIDVNFTPADAWVGEDDAAMLVYVSRPQNASVNFFKGPYRLAGAVLGDATTPPTSPEAIALPFPVVAGQRVYYREEVTRADGRLSADFRLGILAA